MHLRFYLLNQYHLDRFKKKKVYTRHQKPLCFAHFWSSQRILLTGKTALLPVSGLWRGIFQRRNHCLQTKGTILPILFMLRIAVTNFRLTFPFSESPIPSLVLFSQSGWKELTVDQC